MSTIVAQTLSNGTVSTSTANCIQGSAKAWVNFNGSSGAIRASYNVSSITVNGTGSYTITMTNALANINYSITASASVRAGVRVGAIIGINSSGVGAWSDVTPTTTAFGIALADDTSTNYSPTYVCVSVFS